VSESAPRGGAPGVEALLYPTNIAIVGASERPGNWALGVWTMLRKHGFAGRIFPVNPRYQTIWDGQSCYPGLDALPEPPDHAIVLVPGAAAIDALVAAGTAGARSATIFSSGFGEGHDPQGRALQVKLTEAIRASGLAVSGPNCNGNVSVPHRMLTIPDDRITLEPGPVAIFGQSGGIVMALHRTLGSRGVGVSYSVTSGNEIGLNAADYIRFFTADPGIRVIAAFIEAIRDADAFLAACAEAKAAGKPVVAIKLGGSDASRQAALAHTGSLAGALTCFDAVAGAAGVIRMDTLDEIIEVVEFLAHAKIPAGPRLGAITFSGGLKGLLVEAAARTGAVFPQLGEPTLAALREILGVGTSLGNPLDAGFTAISSAEAYFRCIDAMLGDPAIDTLLVQEELPQRLGTNRKIENMREVNRRIAAGVAKPIAVFSMGSYMLTDESRSFRRELPQLPFLQEVQKTVRAVRAVGDYGALRVSPVPPRTTTRPAAEVRAILAAAHRRGDGRVVLDEHDSKALLRAYGLPIAAEQVVTSAGAAAAAAERIGCPVVLKLLSHEITHKSDVGGVALGLGSGEAVRDAFARMAARLAEHDPPLALDRALVARQVAGGLEVVLGVQRDPEMGPVVMFGAGGTLLELYRDVSFGPAPLSAEAAERMIARTHVGRVIDGYRGAARHDRQAVVAALVALGRLADELRERIESVDVNPLAVMADGEGAVVLDALVVLRAPPQMP
jgi:acetyltransferase